MAGAADLDTVLGPILATYDHGMLAWHMSRQALGFEEQLACLRLADSALTAAVEALAGIGTAYQMLAGWRYWQGELTTAHASVAEELQALLGE